MTKQDGGAIADVGNVVIAYWLSKISQQNYDVYPFHTIPEVPGSFEGLRCLYEAFGGNVTVVYKATA
ncbi:MAG: hypothetical protein WCT02_04795, partial [Candidatus Paceibacterota bacterium]